MKHEAGRERAILLVDDEQIILRSNQLFLQSAGITNVIALNDSREVMKTMADKTIEAVVLDLHMPYLSGMELLRSIIREYPQVPVILATADDDVQAVVECMKLGAFDYLVKPIDSGRLVATVRKAIEMRAMSHELVSLKEHLLTDELENPEAFSGIVTCSKTMRAVFHYVEVVAKTSQPIMLSGETGVGKELIAQAIHQASGRKGEFVSVNVAGLDDNLFSDTLFGHKRGAFTGAEQARDGLVSKATGGTLLLDEIGDLNQASQVKLLRLLQEGEYYPAGSDLLKKSEARVVLSTNRDLQELVNSGQFRKDLYYRLYSHRVQLPPLRERPEDIPLLLEHFLERSATQLGKKKPTPPKELAQLLSLYPFPGNVRELEALVFDAVARHNSGILSLELFQPILGTQGIGTIKDDASADTKGKRPSLSDLFGRFPTQAEVETYLIEEAMSLTKGNQSMAAKMLGIGRQTLNKRIQKDKLNTGD